MEEECECVICYETVKDIVPIECNHQICKTCFRNILYANYWQMKPITCPVCRQLVITRKRETDIKE